MSAYQSRYRPRRMTLVLGNIRDAQRYDRFYDLACDAISEDRMPALMLPVGRLLVRWAEDKWSSQDCRTIPPGSSLRFDVRYSGVRPGGEAGVGALYVATVAGALREHAHYASRREPQHLWRPGQRVDQQASFIAAQKAGAPSGGKRFHLYQLDRPLLLADLRPPALWRLLQPLLESGAAQARYGFSAQARLDFSVSAVNDPGDYSAARGVADAVADLGARRGMCGTCALSSRADRDDGMVVDFHGDPTGGCVFALFGRDGEVIDALVPATPTSSFATFAALRAAIA